MVTTTTLHPTVARARLVSPHALSMTGNWRGNTTVSAAPGTTGLATFATNAYGVETIRGNCQVEGAKRFTTRPSRHLATRST